MLCYKIYKQSRKGGRVADKSENKIIGLTHTHTHTGTKKQARTLFVNVGQLSTMPAHSMLL